MWYEMNIAPAADTKKTLTFDDVVNFENLVNNFVPDLLLCLDSGDALEHPPLVHLHIFFWVFILMCMKKYGKYLQR